MEAIGEVDHRLATADLPLDWPALEPWPFIANGVCQHIADERFQRAFARSRLMVRNTTSLLAMVRTGVGVTVLPRLAVDAAEREVSFQPLAGERHRQRGEACPAHSPHRTWLQVGGREVSSTGERAGLENRRRGPASS